MQLIRKFRIYLVFISFVLSLNFPGAYAMGIKSADRADTLSDDAPATPAATVAPTPISAPAVKDFQRPKQFKTLPNYTAEANSNENSAEAGWQMDDHSVAGHESRAIAAEDEAEAGPVKLSKQHHSVNATVAPPHEKLNDVAAEKALTFLRHGNLRYTQGKLRRLGEGALAKDRARLLAGQSPHTIVLSCSDSRVPPEIIFDQRLGEIFVIRSAGETLDSAVLASIEYAVSHLGVQLLLVMGHDSCGAVTAAMQTMPGASAGSPHIDYLVADIQPRIANFLRQPASTGVARESTANARGVVRDLIKRSEIIRKRVSDGTLQVRSSLYHMDTGSVDFD